MKRLLVLLTLVPAMALAQASDPWGSILNSVKPRSLGPVNMGGRIAAIAVYEAKPQIFFVGTASGGLWKTENGGMTLSPIFEKESSVSIGAVAVNQKNPNVIWVGTGEQNSRNSTAWGDGVYMTADGGKTWKNMGLKESMHIAEIVLDPKDDKVVYVAALGRLWGPSKDRGVYKSTDGGATWNKVLFVDDTTGPINLIMDPKNNRTLLCSMWTRQRKAYDFTSGGPGSGLYKSTDGGKTWKKSDKGMPAGPVGRIGISYFPKDSKLVVATVEFRAPSAGPGTTDDDEVDRDRDGGGEGLFASIQGGGQPPAAPAGQGGQPRPAGAGAGGQGRQNQVQMNGGGVYVSKDGGDSWTKMAGTNPRPFYFSTPRFDSEDANRIYLCGVNLHISDDGGKTFRAARASIHADNHALWINPKDSSHMIIGNDGGVYQSRDRAVTWEHINRMPIGQFYAVAFDYRKPYWVYGGLQDNGSWGLPTQSREGGPGFWSVDNVGGGDGFHVQVDPNDWRTVYAESQGGAITRRDISSSQGGRFIQPRPGQGERLRFNWSTPFILSPHNSKTIYLGANKLFKSVNRGDVWKAISPDLTTNDPSKQTPGKNSVTPEDTGAERHCTIVTVSESPMKQGLIYVGTDDGLVWMTQDDGQNWTQLTTNIPDLPKNTWCSRVTASKWVEGRVYATFDGHRSDDFKAYLYFSNDYGKTWSRMGADLPDFDCLYVIREGDKNPDLLYLGSEMGLRMSFDRGKSWSMFRNGFPTVAVHDVQVHPRENDLVIGTHGRSIWTLNVSGFEQLTEENRAKDVFLCRPQNVLLLGNVPGQGWDGDAVFQSPNSQPGTLIQYFLKSDVSGEVKVKISDVAGEASVDLTGPGKAGLNSVAWNGRIRGRLVAPGDYRVTLTVGGKEYATGVHVDAADGG